MELDDISSTSLFTPTTSKMPSDSISLPNHCISSQSAWPSFLSASSYSVSQTKPFTDGSLSASCVSPDAPLHPDCISEQGVAFMAFYTCGCFFTLVLQCTDLRVQWDQTVKGTCWTTRTLKSLSYANQALNITTDLIFSVGIPVSSSPLPGIHLCIVLMHIYRFLCSGMSR
jgi:hypothetical protein